VPDRSGIVGEPTVQPARQDPRATLPWAHVFASSLFRFRESQLLLDDSLHGDGTLRSTTNKVRAPRGRYRLERDFVEVVT
jgi:hypothetical protein